MTPAPPIGVWSRLRADRWAMLALVALAVMSASSVFAPLITDEDPQRLREWIGASAPLSRHPQCADQNHIESGKAIDWCAPPGRATALSVRTQETVATAYRIAIRRGTLEIRASGGVHVDRLELPAGSAEVRAYDAIRWSPAPPQVLTWGEAPPPGLFPRGERAIAARVVESRTEHAWSIALSHGEAGRIACDGVPVSALVTIPGETVTSVAWSGDGGGGGELTVRHWLGTDLGGRDVFARLLYGGRISFMVGLVATAVSLVIGVAWGALAGYCGGGVDRLLMAAVDVLYGLPFMFIVILLLVYVGKDVVVLFLALGAVQWLTMARIVRAQVLSLMRREFVIAARSTGVGPLRLIARHLVPNTAGLIAVYAALTVPAVILEESFLAFIGLTVQYRGQTLESWGALVKYGVDALDYQSGFGWWLLVFPALALVATLLALNLLGEGMRDALDPRQD
jgi:oligopeptide transport system permease protein